LQWCLGYAALFAVGFEPRGARSEVQPAVKLTSAGYANTAPRFVDRDVSTKVAASTISLNIFDGYGP
jgi:hypothetical protein